MSRFYWILGAAIATTAAAWAVSGLGQPLPSVSPAIAPPVAPFFLPTAPVAMRPPPPLPMIMVLPDPGMLPLLPPPIPGQGGAARPPNAENCLDRMARHAALRAYLKARLDLSPQQLPAWQDFESAATESDAEERQACALLAAKPENQTIVQGMDIVEEMLARRLVQIRKVGGPLRKVFATLSPDQLRLLEQSMPLMAL
jgi:LTXXQ motif family protein